MRRVIFYSCLVLLPAYCWAATETATEKNNQAFPDSLIQLNIQVDTIGIEHAIANANQSMREIVAVLKQVGNNKELSPVQLQLIASTVDNINQLTTASNKAVKNLPSAIEYAKQAVVNNSQLFLDDLKFDILMLLASVVIALAILIACLYGFIIKPLQNTIVAATTNVINIAKTIESTSKSLERSNKTHEQILRKLEQDKELTEQSPFIPHSNNQET